MKWLGAFFGDINDSTTPGSQKSLIIFATVAPSPVYLILRFYNKEKSRHKLYTRHWILYTYFTIYGGLWVLERSVLLLSANK